ncbi:MULTISPECIES: DUF3122 domain-containing protein [unclassified Cyanobium]|uniref:DUF3122 domain-containing protein n=1 Tax=unclassified Cyanobium TaxID=2627006 RepID=UPI0020CBF67F|nr:MULTISPECIES: DUF3122 domain-containing protein [unclassified Cyanobium]MCP9860200.1 DUF3122 domain-containing protein [Cyanobium sp. Cruz-8H5]MCP9867450.1 DUF3122 domain-containing protein [Cyanobium sp. Cruz-8D1]
MRASAQSGSGSPGARRRLWSTRLLPLLLGLLLLLTLAPGLARADDAQRWSLRDQDDNRWSLRIFAQPDPAYPSGDRLRLSALTPGIAVDHTRPLLISDGTGGAWTLANRSEELVPPDGGALPEGSAQFDIADLLPRPSGALPLALSLPLAGEASVLLVLGPEETEALHALDDSGAPVQEG